MKCTALVFGFCLAVAGGLAGGCRPAEQPSRTPEAASPVALNGAAAGPDQPSVHPGPSTEPAAVLQSGSLSNPQPARTAAPEPGEVTAAAAAPVVSPEQLATARQLAQDMGVVIQEDAAGNVVLLDTAAKRSWVDDYQMQEMLRSRASRSLRLA